MKNANTNYKLQTKLYKVLYGNRRRSHLINKTQRWVFINYSSPPKTVVMKPENILQSDFLDILFENRNKAYGAYLLRKNYSNRLFKSLAATIAVAFAFVLVYYVHSIFFKKETDATIMFTEVHLEPLPEVQPKKNEEPKPKEKPLSKPIAQEAYAAPEIVEDDKADKPLPAVSDLNDKLISTVTRDGDAFSANEIAPRATEGVKEGDSPAPIAEVIEEVQAPLLHAQVMPEFPGGMEAFRKFMLRNLRQPGNLEEGVKVVVRVQFVVDANGEITNLKVVQSGEELDKEVIRVINKMPRWKAGMQNGKNVPVYFTLPVTFLGPES